MAAATVNGVPFYKLLQGLLNLYKAAGFPTALIGGVVAKAQAYPAGFLYREDIVRELAEVVANPALPGQTIANAAVTGQPNQELIRQRWPRATNAIIDAFAAELARIEKFETVRALNPDNREQVAANIEAVQQWRAALPPKVPVAAETGKEDTAAQTGTAPSASARLDDELHARQKALEAALAALQLQSARPTAVAGLAPTPTTLMVAAGALVGLGLYLKRH